jgi:arylsulfatase A-like enzyme
VGDRPNIILIVVDTLRADHLSCYGYPRPTSPRIDALAEEGVLCERHFCNAIPTQPSFTTLFTGQHPVTHGVLAHGGKTQLAKDAPYLSQHLLAGGYTTCAIDNLVRERQWFCRGYEFYIDPSVRRPLLLGVTCEELNSRAIPWLRAHAAEPFFLFIHYWDPHWPLDPPTRYRHLFYKGNPTDPNNHTLDGWWKDPLGAIARDTWLRRSDGVVTDADYVEALYDQEIRHLDDGVAELLATLDDLQIADNTMVVLTGDHGESMTEHGIFFSHHGLYDSTIHVPLMLRWPARIPAGRRLPHMFEAIDVAPTLLDAAGLPIPRAFEGRSLFPLVTGERNDGGTDRVVSVEGTWKAQWSLRTDRYKYILSREPAPGEPADELYDLLADPGEERNITWENRSLAAEMREELEAWIQMRLKACGRKVDPLIEQGVSLGAFGGVA